VADGGSIVDVAKTKRKANTSTVPVDVQNAFRVLSLQLGGTGASRERRALLALVWSLLRGDEEAGPCLDEVAHVVVRHGLEGAASARTRDLDGLLSGAELQRGEHVRALRVLSKWFATGADRKTSPAALAGLAAAHADAHGLRVDRRKLGALVRREESIRTGEVPSRIRSIRWGSVVPERFLSLLLEAAGLDAPARRDRVRKSTRVSSIG
jgi:hypothetical protein